MKEDTENVEHYDCCGNYMGPPPPLPKNMEIMSRVLTEYMEKDVDGEPAEVWERHRIDVEALPEYRGDTSREICPPRPIVDEEIYSGESGSFEDVWESESTFPEVSEEIISSGEESFFSEDMECEISEEDADSPSYYSSIQDDPPENKLPVHTEVLNLYDLNTAVVVPKDQKWTDLTDAGYKLAAAGKYMGGQRELVGPLSMYFSSGAAAMKEKLKGTDADFHEAVKDVLSGMMVDNLVQSQAANMVMMSLETPFSSEYMKLLKTRHQLENQVLKIIETKQMLTTIPIRIKNAAQVNVGQVQQVVNNDGQGE
ncbi:MAG: hypothetical protein WCP55_18485 [Lentisphaerota bacterium]